ncbi:MAG: hypothetical protein GXP49_01340 [Deltaproteobacteria bacterium]|nr:hypothetical protein [Deltaproteobacteria bacterium]
MERLSSEVQELKESAPKDSLAIGIISGSLDRILAAFIISLGAAAYDMEVHLFFSFWSISALRDSAKKAKKNFLGKMFGWMLPKGTRKLKLSQMNMAGMGPKMIRMLMDKNGVPSLEDMVKQAGEFGVKIYVCQMSMDLMGISKDELIDYPNLKLVGVSTFLALAQEAKQTFFL